MIIRHLFLEHRDNTPMPKWRESEVVKARFRCILGERDGQSYWRFPPPSVRFFKPHFFKTNRGFTKAIIERIPVNIDNIGRGERLVTDDVYQFSEAFFALLDAAIPIPLPE